MTYWVGRPARFSFPLAFFLLVPVEFTSHNHNIITVTFWITAQHSKGAVSRSRGLPGAFAPPARSDARFAWPNTAVPGGAVGSTLPEIDQTPQDAGSVSLKEAAA